MSKINSMFYWLKQNFKGILVFFTLLAMGTGIVPTIEHGERFVAAIQYEKMVETSSPHIIAKEIEVQFNLYILNVQISDEYAVAWVLLTGDQEDASGLLYTFFYVLSEHYPNRMAYYILVAEAIPVKGVDGECTVVRGLAEYGISDLGMKKLLGWGKANAKNSLDLLFNEGEFSVAPFYYNAPYLGSLMEREPGHVPPWKQAEEAE